MRLCNLVILAQTVHEKQQRSRRIFNRFLYFDNCLPEIISDVISGIFDQNVGMVVCDNFGDSRLTPTEASFSAPFRTSITSDRKYIVTSRHIRCSCSRPDGCEGLCKIW